MSFTYVKRRPGKDIWVVGGAELTKDFIERDLIDEFAISIDPVILGAGILLFAWPLPTRWLRLLGCNSFDSGLVQLTYSRKRSS